MEYKKITSFVDLAATGAEKDAFIKQILEIIEAQKKAGTLEFKLAGSSSSKEVLKIMQETTKAQTDLINKNKQYEKSLLDKARAEKLAAASTKDLASANLANAKATTEAAKAGVLGAKTATEQARAKKIQLAVEKEVNREKERTTKALQTEQRQLEKNTNAYEQLKHKYLIAANTSKRLGAELGIESEEFKQASAAAQNYGQQLFKLEQAVGQSQRNVGNYTQSTFALTQVLREAPAFANSFATGISAIGNNVPMLVEQFKQLSAQLGSSRQAFGIMAKSLLSFTAILPIAFLLIQLFSKQISEFFSNLFSGSKSFDKLRESQVLLNKAFEETSYKEAVKNVSELRINIDLAKKGFLDKTKVLKQYNDTLGDSIGEAKSLNEAEALLIKNGDAYIKMTLFKAAANLALEEAAKKAVEIEKKRQKLTPEAGTDLQRAAGQNATKEEIIQYNKTREEANKAFFEGDKKRADELFAKVDKLYAEFTERGFAKKLKTQLDGDLNIAKTFQESAAKLAASFGLDFFSGKGDTKDNASKSREDFKRDAEKELLERQKILNEITRTKLQGQANQSLDIATDETKSFADRLDAYQAYYDKIQELNRFNTKAELEELAARTAEEKRQVQDKLDDKTTQLTTKQRKDLNDQLVNIDAKAQAETELIKLKGNETFLAFDREYEDALTELTKKNIEEREKLRLEAIKKKKEALDDELSIQQNSLARLRDDELRSLTELYNKGEIKKKEFERRKLDISRRFAIESLDNELDYYEKLLKLTTNSEEQRYEIEAKIAALRLKKDDELTAKKIKNLEILADARKRLGEEAVTTVQAIIVAGFEREKNEIQDQIDLLEAKKQKDIEVANATSANAAEAADKVTVINARAQAQREALERRQRQIQQEKARFEKAASIVRIIAETASAVAEALPNIPLALIVGGIGALQLARTIATPIPRYAGGLQEAAADHLAFVGDGGRREFVKYPDGSGWITPDRPTLTLIPKGASVVPSLDKAGVVYDGLAAGFFNPGTPDNGIAVLAGAVIADGAKTRKAIKDKRENHFTIKNGEVSMITKDGYNETIYLNRNLTA